MHTLCSECTLGSDTYYRLVAGHEYALDVYIRLLECYNGYCESDRFLSLCREFLWLGRAEMCVARGMEMEREVRETWEKYDGQV